MSNRFLCILLMLFMGFMTFSVVVLYFNMRKTLHQLEQENNVLGIRNEKLINSFISYITGIENLSTDRLIHLLERNGKEYDNTKPLLIIRISDNSCVPCLDRELKNLSNFERVGIPVIIVGSFKSEKLLAKKIEEYHIQSPFINIRANQLFSFEESNPSLYLFVMIDGKLINHLFFPVQEEDELSRFYYQYITGLYAQ